MPICKTCGIEVEQDDLYEVNGQQVCEECLNAVNNPSKPCNNS